jgi:hypothetical protein
VFSVFMQNCHCERVKRPKWFGRQACLPAGLLIIARMHSAEFTPSEAEVLSIRPECIEGRTIPSEVEGQSQDEIMDLRLLHFVRNDEL